MRTIDRGVRKHGWRAALCVTFVLAAAAAQAQQAPAIAGKPPLLNRANEALPAWLRVRGEFRERVEGVSNAGFVDGRDDTYWLSRFRFNASITPMKGLAFQVQAQDARVADKLVGGSGTPFRAPFDLRMAFADLGAQTSVVAARVGRQELAYGDQRLVGHVSWLNAARTFDAAKLTLRSKAVQVDLFGASVVRVLEQSFDRSGNGNRFYGAYATAGALIPKASFEPFVFWKQDRSLKNEAGALADLHAATVGVRWVGRLPARLDYNTEMAAQTGSLGSDSVAAWASHWQLRETYPGPHAVRISAELNLASGDSDSADGTRGTFDQLYPTPHDKYGLADQVGWRNIRHVRTGIEFTPGRKWNVGANYHSWWLMESRDALYGAGGAAVARVATGATSTHVGQELDAQVSRQLTPQLALAGGLAHIFPGGFLRQTNPGASYTAPFVMATYVFLADK